MKNTKIASPRAVFFSQISPHSKPDTIRKIHTPTVEFSVIGSGFKASMLVKCACTCFSVRVFLYHGYTFSNSKNVRYFREVRISCCNPRKYAKKKKKINESTYWNTVEKWTGRQLQWIPSFLRKTLNRCSPKTYGKKDMEKI